MYGGDRQVALAQTVIRAGDSIRLTPDDCFLPDYFPFYVYLYNMHIRLLVAGQAGNGTEK